MKKITFLIAFVSLLSWQGMAQTFNGGACPMGLAIPDNLATGINDTVVVTGAGTALGTDVILEQVNLYATHTWGSDLTITITSPNGVTDTLASGNGGNGQQYGDSCTSMTNFIMNAATSITAGAGNFIGSYIPQQSFLNFNDGSSPTGNWIVNVSDNAGGDTGNLEYIELIFAAPPACTAPSALSAANQTATTADVSWTENGTATAWDIEWDTTGFTQGTGTMVTGTTTNPHTLTGLTASTSYDFYVRANCGGTNGTSVWIGPFTFTTAGTCGLFSFDLEDSFGDGWNGGYIKVYINGTFIDSLTLLNGTGPVRTQLPVNTGDVISVAYTAGSFSTENSYLVYDETNALVATQGAGGTTPGNIGDYTIPTGLTSCALCLTPSALAVTNVTSTSVNLAWTENGTATTWDIEWDTTGFTQGTGTMITGTTTNPYALTGLTPNTSYDYYVRAACGGTNGNSTWASFTFKTACTTFTAPYVETFEDPTSSGCWSMSLTSPNYSWFTNVGPTPSGSTGPLAASIPAVSTDTVYIYAEASAPAATGDIATLNSPLIDLTGLTNPTLTFEYHMYGADIDRLIISAGNSTNMVYDTIIGQQQTATDSLWRTRTISLSSLSGTIQLGFTAIRGAGWNGDIAIDDVNITTAVGIDALTKNINLNVYPNPTNGVFTLNVNTTNVKELDIKIINVQGQVVYNKNKFKNINNVNEQIDLSNNAKGIYFVVLTSDKGVVTRKIIVQ